MTVSPPSRSFLDATRDASPRAMLTGVLSHAPGLFDWWDRRRPMGNTASASYARGVWRLHLANAATAGMPSPRAVGELGPGASLGACIAALLDGVETAVGLDAGQYANPETNQRVLTELLSVDQAEEPPALRQAVAAAGGPDQTVLRYAAPWTDKGICPADSLDLVFSHSVMEHVDDPAATYAACAAWLRPGGVMSHKIDHSSHGVTHSWNGHYSLPPALWNLIYGRRPYLLNRLRPRVHLDMIRAAGFEILPESRFVIDEGGVQRTISLKDPWPDDLWVRTSEIIARKPGR